jgi:hypothetical protein
MRARPGGRAHDRVRNRHSSKSQNKPDFAELFGPRICSGAVLAAPCVTPTDISLTTRTSDSHRSPMRVVRVMNRAVITAAALHISVA